MFRKKVAEKTKSHILCFIPFLYENRGVYEITWKNILEPGRPQTIAWRMRIACWMPNATNTRSKYVMLIAFPMQQLLHESATMSRYA